MSQNQVRDHQILNDDEDDSFGFMRLFFDLPAEIYKQIPGWCWVFLVTIAAIFGLWAIGWAMIGIASIILWLYDCYIISAVLCGTIGFFAWYYFENKSTPDLDDEEDDEDEENDSSVAVGASIVIVVAVSLGLAMIAKQVGILAVKLTTSFVGWRALLVALVVVIVYKLYTAIRAGLNDPFPEIKLPSIPSGCPENSKGNTEDTES